MTKTKLKKIYDKYIQQVMNSGTSISFEATLYILDLIEKNKSETMLDLSCGFSSVALRTLQNKKVITIHDNKDYLDKTLLFLVANQIPFDNFHFANCINDFKIDADFIVYKFSDDGKVRFFNFPIAYNCLKENGLMYIDDMHGNDPAFRNLVSGIVISPYEFKYLSIETWDSFGRFGSLINKKVGD